MGLAGLYSYENGEQNLAKPLNITHKVLAAQGDPSSYPEEQ